MEPDDDRELSRLLREWEAPELPATLEAGLFRRRNTGSRIRFAAALAFAAALGAAAMFVVRPPPAAPIAAEQPFVPAPGVLPLDSFETGRVVRVDVPVSALIAAGYDMADADPQSMVTADVLIGEDGRLHAVRLINKTSNGTGD